jgi:hypothetical protein
VNSKCSACILKCPPSDTSHAKPRTRELRPTLKVLSIRSQRYARYKLKPQVLSLVTSTQLCNSDQTLNSWLVVTIGCKRYEACIDNTVRVLMQLGAPIICLSPSKAIVITVMTTCTTLDQLHASKLRESNFTETQLAKTPQRKLYSACA